MSQIFENSYYGNTILQWAIAFSLILFSVVLGRLIYILIGRYIKRLTAKTETKLDDIIIDKVEEPMVGVLILIGVRYALNTLTLTTGVAEFVGNLFNFATTILIAWLILRLYDAIHEEYIVALVSKTDTDLDDQILPVVRSGIRIMVIALGIVVGLNNAGYDVQAVLAGLGIGGLAFALAAQDTVSNLFGGITIFIQRPFQIGDMIIVSDQWLIVDEIGLRTSTLTDYYYGHTVILPNSQFTSNKITNVTRFPGQIVYRKMLLSPFMPIEQFERARQLVTNVINEHPQAALYFCRIDAINPEGVSLYIGYTVDVFDDRHRVMSEIFLSSFRAFEKENIKLALPIQMRLNDIPDSAVGRIS